MFFLGGFFTQCEQTERTGLKWVEAIGERGAQRRRAEGIPFVREWKGINNPPREDSDHHVTAAVSLPSQQVGPKSGYILWERNI